MKPYKKAASKNLFPIYWDSQRCPCEKCVSNDDGTRSSSSQSAEATRSSFTIESLLGQKEENSQSANLKMVALVSNGSCASAELGQLNVTNVGAELRGRTSRQPYLTSAFQRMSSLSVNQVPIFDTGNLLAEGKCRYVLHDIYSSEV